MRSVSNYRLLYVALLLTALSCPAAAHNGAVAIAVPLEGIVVDGDLSDWLSWGQLGGLGDVVLAGQGAGVGNMAGRITWQTGQGVARTQVKIFSSDSQEPLAQVWTDQQGYYATILPSGTYRIEPAIGHTRGRQVEIRDGRSAEVEEMAIAHPLGSTARSGVGKHRKAGGRSVKAGMGERHGAWRTLAVADGLPDPSVTDIAQDREGICGLPPTATAWPATMALSLWGIPVRTAWQEPGQHRQGQLLREPQRAITTARDMQMGLMPRSQPVNRYEPSRSPTQKPTNSRPKPMGLIFPSPPRSRVYRKGPRE